MASQRDASLDAQDASRWDAEMGEIVFLPRDASRRDAFCSMPEVKHLFQKDTEQALGGRAYPGRCGWIRLWTVEDGTCRLGDLST